MSSSAPRAWSLLPLCSLVVLQACGNGSGDGDDLPPPLSAGDGKDGHRPPVKLLPTPALATLRTPAGTQIDFLEPVVGAGILVTEAGPVEVDPVWRLLARKYPGDVLALSSKPLAVRRFIYARTGSS